MSSVAFDHIAIAMPRIADAVPVLAGILGGRPAFGALTPDYRFGQWQYDRGGRIEVLEPGPADGFLARFLARSGPGIHHVTFKVPSLADACRRAEAAGYEIVGYNDSKTEWMEAFLHPKQALGIVVQLAQSKPSAEARPPRPWKPPAAAANPPPPVAMIGLRMRAPTRERARDLWEGIALGELDDAPDGALMFHWPGSPLRIAVDIDAARPAGPVTIEYASARPVTIPPEATITVGTRFSRVARRAGPVDTEATR